MGRDATGSKRAGDQDPAASYALPKAVTTTPAGGTEITDGASGGRPRGDAVSEGTAATPTVSPLDGALPANRQLPPGDDGGILRRRMEAFVDDLAAFVAQLAFEGRLTDDGNDEREPPLTKPGA